MVSPQPVLLVVAADRREFASFQEHGFELTPCSLGLCWSARTTIDGSPALLVANGPGRENARAAVESVRATHRIQAVVSTGFAGALEPALRVADIFVATRVLQLRPRLEYAVRLPGGSIRPSAAAGKLLTIDEVAATAERKAQLLSTGAKAVDMEASAVAAVAHRCEAPFYCVRVISDEAATSFAIDFNRARRANGGFSGWGILGQALVKPACWRQLVRLRRDARQASRALAAFFQQVEFDI